MDTGWMAQMADSKLKRQRFEALKQSIYHQDPGKRFDGCVKTKVHTPRKPDEQKGVHVT